MLFVESTYSLTTNNYATIDFSDIGFAQLYSPPPNKTANLTVTPDVGGSNTLFTFEVETTATTPYNVTWHFYDDTGLVAIAEATSVSQPTVSYEAYGFQFGYGTFYVNATIIDADGDTIYSNTEEFRVTTAKTVQLTVSPEIGYYPLTVELTLLTSNLAKPYTAELFFIKNGILLVSHNYTGITDDVFKVTTGLGVGNWTFYMKVVDADNEVLYTNNVSVQVLSGIQEFSFVVVPTIGNQFTTFHLETTNISGGHAPYTVYMEIQRDSLVVANWEICTNVPENGTCIYDFTMSGFDPDDYYLFVKAMDDIGYRYATGYQAITITGAPIGPPLSCNLTTIPQNYTNKDVIQLFLHIEGGTNPYKVDWLDHNTPQCTNEIYDFEAPLDIVVRVQLYAGHHSIKASITSADGQSCVATLDLTIGYEEGGVSDNAWLDCIGNISTIGTTCGNGICEPEYGENTYTCPEDCYITPPPAGNYTPPYTPPQNVFTPLIDVTELPDNVKFMGVFLTPFMIANYFMLIISTAIGYYVKRGEAFVVSILVFLIAYTIYGIYPLWAGITLIIITGMIVAYMLRSIFYGG